MIFFRHVAFDLDDTLLDTSGALIPAAARRAVEAMTSALGGSHDIQAWLNRRIEILRGDARADVWMRLASGDEEIADIGRRAFFSHPIEMLPAEALRPTPGAFEILEWTRKRATLHLVTSGDPATQKKKIERLGIASFFKTIQFVEGKHGRGGENNRAKFDAFQKIQNNFPGEPASSFVSVGNRVDTDLGEAKRLGWSTAWIRYGEHASLTPGCQEEIPDLEVASLADLLSIWQQQYDSEAAQESTWKT